MKNKKHLRKKFIYFIAIFIVTLICSACGKQESTGDKKDMITLNIAYMPNFGSLHDIIAGVNSGIFEKEGIKVNLVEFADGATIIAAMESGSIDIGNIGPGAHRLAIEDRAHIISFSQLGNADEVLGLSDKGVTTLNDLKGKKIAVASGTSADTILQLALKEVGLTQTDVEIVDMEATAIVSAVLSGAVDAAATWSPNTFIIKEKLGDKVKTLADNARYKQDYPAIASYIVNKSYAEKNSETIKRFLKGLYQAMDYRSQNMDTVVEWVAKQVGSDIATTKMEINDGKWLTSAELQALLENGEMQQYYQKQQENFISAGIVKQKRNVNEYVDFNAMKSALDELKKKE